MQEGTNINAKLHNKLMNHSDIVLLGYVNYQIIEH